MRHQGEYYRLLSAVRTQGDWEAWIGFFLDAVTGAATEAEGSIIARATLVTSDRRRLLGEPMAGSLAYRLFEMLPTTPRFTIESIRQKLATSFPDCQCRSQVTGRVRYRGRAQRATQESGVQLPVLHRYPVPITLPICNEPSVDAIPSTA